MEIVCVGACALHTLGSKNRLAGLKISEPLTFKMLENTYKYSAHGYSLHTCFSMEEIELPVKSLQRNGWHITTITSVLYIKGLQNDNLQTHTLCPVSELLLPRSTILRDFSQDFYNTTYKVLFFHSINLTASLEDRGVLEG